MGVPLPLHLRDALREAERHVVHLRVVIVWRAALQFGWVGLQRWLGLQRGLVSAGVHRGFLGDVSGAPGAATKDCATRCSSVHASAGDCAAAVARVRTGMACVLCWSFSLVGAGSSARAGPSLVCWLLILIRAGSSEPGAPSPGATADFAFARISHLRAQGHGRKGRTRHSQ